MPSTDHTVLIERINLEDRTFQVTTETAVETLAASIARLGVMHPPVLLGDNTQSIVISGFRRIAACRFMGISEIPVKLLPPETDKKTCVQMAIADNSLQRPLNLIEISRALILLFGVYPDSDDLCRAAGDMGLPDNFSAIHKLRQLSCLAEEIQEGVLSNVLSLAMALELGHMEKPCGVAMATLFGYLKLGLNKQREILTMIQEIAFREHVSVQDILNTSDLQQIMMHEKWDRSQKTVHLRQYLKRRRYPSITAFESDFEANVRSLDLESGIVLSPPRYFEGTTYCFQLTFNNLAQLQQRISCLAKASTSHSLNEILNGCRFANH